MALQLESRPYGPESTPEEILAIRECIYVCEDDIVMYREVPVMSLYQVGVFHQKLNEIDRTMSSYKLLLDLTGCQPPDAEIRARLKVMFGSQRHLRAAAAYTGDNFMLSVASQFVFTSFAMRTFSAHQTREEALAALRSNQEPKSAGVATRHLMEIGFGSCSISPEMIMAERNDRPMAEILTGLLFLHEELQMRERQRAAAEAEVLRRAEELRAANVKLVAANEALDMRGKELQSLYEQLKKLDVLKTQFFANISHEFRTPLTLMLGPIEDALADNIHTLSPEQHGRLELAHRNALRLLKLVNALLDFARIEAGRMQAVYEPTDLAMLTQDLASCFESAMSKAGLKYTVSAYPVGEPVFVDREMWEKIVLNLLSNAFKFTLHGEVAVSLCRVEDHVELSVQDTGLGIPEQELSNIFKRFHRIEGAHGRTYEGTGIGLALIQELVKLHGGTIAVTSKIGSGSTLTVRIPLGSAHLPSERLGGKRAAASTAIRAEAFVEEALHWLPDAAPLQPSFQDEIPRSDTGAALPTARDVLPGRILLADDNADMLGYLKRTLSPYWHVTAVSDGQEALQEALGNNYDLILSDVMMPNLDGIGLVRALRGSAQTRTLPVILLSARVGQEAAVEGLSAGADDYLCKPFTAQELLARVRAHLTMARMRNQLNAELMRTNQELQASKERLDQSARELARSNAELEQFAYVASHDLQEPLRKVQSFGDLLVVKYLPSMDEQAQHYVNRMQDGARRMQGLINDLLTYARVTSQARPFVAVDLARVVREVMSDLEARVKSSCGLVEIRELPQLETDPLQMRQLLQNLIGNALKFHRPDVPPVIVVAGRVVKNGDSLTLEHSRSDQICEITIQDNGIGFEEKYLDRIFLPFQRLHGRGEYEGTGMGLAICRKIVERHGGTLTARSTTGQGATFVILLPLSQPKGKKRDA